MDYVLILNDVRQMVTLKFVDNYFIKLTSFLQFVNTINPLIFVPDVINVNLFNYSTQFSVIVVRNNTNENVQLLWNK